MISIKDRIFIYITLFVFYLPDAISVFVKNSTLLSLSLIFLKILCVIWSVLITKRIKLDLTIVFLILFSISQLCSQLLNKGEVRFALSFFLMFYTVSTMVDVFYRRNNVGFFKIIYYYVFLLVLLNLCSMLLYPIGLTINNEFRYGFYLLGNYNGFVVYYFLGFIVGYVLINEFHVNIKKSWYILWLIAFISSGILQRSATSIIGITLLFIYLMFYNSKTWSFIFNLKNYIILIIVLFFMIIIFRKDFFLMNYIKSVFHKSTSYVARIDSWNIAIEAIKEKPFFGFGLLETSQMQEKFFGQVGVHNIILQSLFCRGLIGTTILFSFFGFIAKNFKIICNYRIKGFFEAICGIFLLMWMFEVYGIGIVFLYFCLMKAYTNTKEKKIKYFVYNCDFRSVI